MPEPVSVVLLSGGLDSAVVLHHAIEHAGRADLVHALTLNYGQRHGIEINHAHAIALAAGVVHEARGISVPFWEQAPLVSQWRDDSPSSSAAVLPGRNTILVTLAAMYAARVGAVVVWLGCCADDAAVFADCRLPWLLSAEETLTHGLAPIQLRAPFLGRTKGEIVRDAKKRGGACWDAVALTWSCYSPRIGRPCDECGACSARARGFEAAGIVDPAR